MPQFGSLWSHLGYDFLSRLLALVVFLLLLTCSSNPALLDCCEILWPNTNGCPNMQGQSLSLYACNLLTTNSLPRAAIDACCCWWSAIVLRLTFLRALLLMSQPNYVEAVFGALHVVVLYCAQLPPLIDASLIISRTDGECRTHVFWVILGHLGPILEHFGSFWDVPNLEEWGPHRYIKNISYPVGSTPVGRRSGISPPWDTYHRLCSSRCIDGIVRSFS